MGNIVLVGAGGSGISSLAYIFMEIGYTNIKAIDKYESQLTNNLKQAGVDVIIGHGIYNIEEEDFVIYSDAAISSPEVQKSLEYGKLNPKKFHYPFSYHEFLGEISKYFKTIAIAGTHGKSTTTSMGIYALSQLDPNFALGVVGALVPQLDNKNYFLNSSLIPEIKQFFDHIVSGMYKHFDHKAIKKYTFMVEADEFNKHFLYYDPDYTVIINMELDHTDVYDNFEQYLSTFQELYNKTRFGVYGLKKNKEIQYLDDFQEKIKLLDIKNFEFKYIFGDHNIGNGSLIYGLIKDIFPKISTKALTDSMNNFKGIRRRMEFLKNNENGATIYSDYGHHPSEIEAVYNAFRKNFPEKKLVAVFQPHQARRVLEFWDNFINILRKFDEVTIFDIYIARENLEDLKKQFKNKEYNDINTIEELGNIMAEKSGGKYTSRFDDVAQIIENAKEDAIVINFSAGDLDYKLRNEYLIMK